MIRVYFILRLFCCIFRENYKLHVIIYTPIPVLCLGMILFYVCRFLDIFTLTLTLIKYDLTPHRCPQVTMPVEEKKSQRILRQRQPQILLVKATVRGEFETACLFVFPHLVTEDA